MKEYVFNEEHSTLDLEYLERSHIIREELLLKQLSPEEFKERLSRQMSYARARIPTEFWNTDIPMRAPREIVLELVKYVNNAANMFKHGLGLTLVGPLPVYKLQPLYVVCRQLVDQDFSCFVVPYDELVFWVRESRENKLLGKELRERFEVDFFFLVEIPDNDDPAITVRQELLARLEIRLDRNRPVILAVNSGILSLNDIMPGSFLGRLVLPLTRANKPLILEEVGDVDSMFEGKWGLLDGED